MITDIRKKLSRLFVYAYLPVIAFIINSPTFAGTGDIAHFLSTTDIHFDPFSTCKNAIPCPLIENLRKAPSNQWKTILAEQDTEAPTYEKDTNFKLLESALAGYKKVAASQKPRFVLVLGDLLAHDYQENFAQYSSDNTLAAYQSFVKKSMEFLASEMNTTFPKTDVYYIVGNHDSYNNVFSSYPNGTFFKDMSDIWSDLIKNKDNQDAMQRTFPTGGYYAVDIPHQSNLRLIVLNSVLFSTDAEGDDIANTAVEELNWLHEELNAAHSKQQHVIIALHIPAGVDIYSTLKSAPFKMIDFWQPEYTSRFLTELDEYAADISAILPGHFHMDWFQVYTATDGHNIPISGTPGISSVLGNNPAFKIFSYNTQSLQLENFKTFAYSFKTNDWTEEYDFNAMYQPTWVKSFFCCKFPYIQSTESVC
jgi:sphingomyelin phosphodiesterase acid-like 3